MFGSEEEMRQEYQKLVMVNNGLKTQLNANKQVINEMMDTNINLRTNLNLYQESHQELSTLKNKADNEVKELKIQLCAEKEISENLRKELAHIAEQSSASCPTEMDAELVPAEVINGECEIVE